MRSTMMERPAADEYAPFYAGYVGRVGPDEDVIAALAVQAGRTAALLGAVEPSRAGFRYAAGKWSIGEVVGHLADAERIMTYRALRIARNDATPLAGFDENAYVPSSGAERRQLTDLAAELAAVRAATVALFRGLPDDAWPRRGVANGTPVSVRALAHIILGHERHHLETLRNRYGIGE